MLLEFFIINPIVLIFGAIGSYWLAARAFSPIDRLTRTTQHIQAGNLQQRVPLPRARDEVFALAKTLNEMIERLEESFTRQRRFVADASHELRTPVAAIRSITDLALSQELTPQEYIILLENINTESERLGHLISDLLALARSDEGKTHLDYEPVRLDLLIEAVVANAEVLANERGITIQVQAQKAITIWGDEARLIQAVINLLDNAILYTNPGGQVTVTLEEKNARIYLSVHDTGIGIAPEHLSHIFERFYRVDQARIRTEGNSSGLGLAIVEWVVKAHGGWINVESRPGYGSTFTITWESLTKSNISSAASS
jgi:heavy metal sensor kinase